MEIHCGERKQSDSLWRIHIGHKLSGIDLVYTWVDGADPAWLATRRPYYWGQNSAYRWKDSGELQQSLISARSFAPWVRKTFIVHADCQRPQLEDSSYILIPHSQIIPKKLLPTFNSQTIEAYLHHIPGLSERFLYANDDTSFTTPMEPGDYFSGDKPLLTIDSARSRPINRAADTISFLPLELIKALLRAAKPEAPGPPFIHRCRSALEVGLWRCAMANADALLPELPQAKRYPPIHQIRPTRKSHCEAAWTRYGETLGRTTQAKFRSKTCIAFINFLVPYLAHSIGEAEFRDLAASSGS